MFETSSFVFVIDEGQTVDININLMNNNEVTTLESAQADSSWATKDGLVSTGIEFKTPDDVILANFTAFNPNNHEELKDGKTLFDILKDGTFGNYFKNTNGSEDVSTLLQNVNTHNYVYLELNGTAPYNYAEFYAKVNE